MSTNQNSEYEVLQNQLAGFRDIHRYFNEIVTIQSQTQKEQFICDSFKKLVQAEKTSLFIFDPKNDSYVFKATSDKTAEDYSGGLLEIGMEPGSVQSLPVQAGNKQNVSIQTEKKLIKLKGKHIYLAPVKIASEVSSFLLCEYDEPREIRDELTVEKIQLYLELIRPLLACVVKQQKLEEQAISLQLLYDIGNKLSSERNEDKLLENILNLIEKYIQVDRCSLMIMDADQKYLSIKKAIGMDDVDIKSVKVPVGEGIAGFVAAGKRPLLIKDISKETHLVSQATKRRQFRTNSLLSVPLVVQQEVIGVINVNNRKDGHSFSQSDMELLTTIGSEIAIILQRSYMKLQIKKSKDLDQDISRLMV